MTIKCQSKDLNKAMITSVNNIKKFKLMLEQ